MGALQIFRVELAFPSFSYCGSVGIAGKMDALLVFRVELFLVVLAGMVLGRWLSPHCAWGVPQFSF